MAAKGKAVKRKAAMKSPNPVNVYVRSGVISVDQEPVHVWGPRATITWVMQTPGYSFHANTISIQNDDGREFAKSSHSKSKHVWSNKNSFPKTYKYTVSVMRDAGAPHPQPLDPNIVNQG